MNGNCGECDLRWACVIDPAVCEKMTKPVPTNGDKIRAMTDEEMADLLRMFCHGIKACEDCPFYYVGCPMSGALQDWVKWLQQPSEADHAQE